MKSPVLSADWNDPAWADSELLEIASFRPEGSDHHPQTFARMMHSDAGLHGIYLVRDQFVRCTRQNYFDPVWKDSCVEFFCQPKPDCGYFNFEFNCGGAFLASYRVGTRSKAQPESGVTRLPWSVGSQIQVKSSLPHIVDPEISTPVDWTLQFFIPFVLLEKYVGDLGEPTGQIWRANFYKCAEDLSHPHWAAWAPVDELNFHLPKCFGEIAFD